MEYEPRDWPSHSSYCRLFWKIIAICVVVLVSADSANNTLYVSKAHGSNGNNTCHNSTSPCKTLNYVIERASSNDVIVMDATNTEQQPYDNCSSQTLKRNLSFTSWNGSAVINCSGRGLSFTGGLTASEVSFRSLRFIDTFVRLVNASLIVTNCTFGSFQLNRSYFYIINVSLSTKISTVNIKISLTNSSFMENNLAGCLSVVNRAKEAVLVKIESSSIINNKVENLPNLVGESLISVFGEVNFSFVNSKVSNTTFSKDLLEPSVFVFAEESEVLQAENRTLMSREFLYDVKSAVSTIRFVGGDFAENRAKILRVTFKRLTQLDITNSNFSTTKDHRTAGGVIFVNSTYNASSVQVHFNNCWFVGNEGISYSTVLYFKLSNSVHSIVSLERCYFNNNKDNPLDELLGNGATVYIEAGQLSLTVVSCEFNQNQAAMTGAVYVKTYQPSNLQFYQTHFKSCSCWAEATDGSGGITVIFSNSQNHQQQSERSQFGLLIEDCVFYNNSAKFWGTGAYRAVYPASQSSGNITIRRSHFEKNLARFGAGGVSISSNFHCSISDTIFRDNAGFEAGAIYITGGYLMLRNCTLDNNYGGSTASTLASGSLRMSGNGTAVIRNSKSIQGYINRSFGSYLNFHGGVSLFSSEFKSIIFDNSSFEFLWEPSIEKIIVMEISQSNFTLDNATVIRCPTGYRINTMPDINSTKFEKGISFQCRLCPMGTYSVDQGVYSGDNKRKISCLLCPYGAKCMKGLQALPNFWGYRSNEVDPPRIKFSRCPLGYCCQAQKGQKSCFPYTTCNSQRGGWLCGECSSEFSETLFTPSCRKSEKCNDFWLWPVAVIFVLGLSVYLIIQPDFVGILWNWVTWFSSGRSKGDVDNDKVFDPGYERIVFFYYQATDVLLADGTFEVWEKFISQFVLGLFNFEIRLDMEGFACPFPGLNPVSKILLRSLGVFSVLLAILVIFLFHCFLCFCLRRERPKSGSYLSAFIKGVLLGYAVLTGKSMKLVKCVEVNGVNCLFVNCNIQCYTWWQTVLLTSVLVYFVPFALVLYFGSYKLFDKKISVCHFILACFFPLAFLSYWFITRRAFVAKYVPDSGGRGAVTSHLIGSYRAPDLMSRGAIYWESVLIGRMLVLILANALIEETFLRSLTLVLICVVNLSVHVYVFPFELLAANRAETVSLFSLVLIAIFNVPISGYLSEGVVPTGPISKIMDIFSWCQAFLVVLLPFLCILLVLSAVVSQAVRLVCFICKCCRCACFRVYYRRYQGQEQLVNPLIAT